ncbi:MAG: hypothetical protein ACRCTX_26460 [Afipia sp.]
MTPFRLPLSQEGCYLAAGPLQSVLRAKHTPMLVETDGEESIIKAINVEITQTGRLFIADKITGTLYEEGTGRCMSSERRRLIGPVPEGHVLKKREAKAFEYGYQAIGGKKAKPKKDPNASRNDAGKVCGASKHSAKLTEADVRLIRQKRPGTTTRYVLTNKQCQERFGVSKCCVDDVRMRRTWRHVP